MARKTLYKTFYLEGGYSDYAFESALGDYAGRGSKAEFRLEWREVQPLNNVKSKSN